MILIVFYRKSPAYSHLFSSIFSSPLIALALQARHVFPFPLSFSFLSYSRCNHKSERRKRPIKFLFAWELEVERSWCRDGERSEWRRKWARGKKREKRSGTEEVRTKELSNEPIPVDSPSIILSGIVTGRVPFASRDLCCILSHATSLFFCQFAMRRRRRLVVHT